MCCVSSKTSSGGNHWRSADVCYLFWCWKWDSFWRYHLWRLQSKITWTVTFWRWIYHVCVPLLNLKLSCCTTVPKNHIWRSLQSVNEIESYARSSEIACLERPCVVFTDFLLVICSKDILCLAQFPRHYQFFYNPRHTKRGYLVACWPPWVKKVPL